MTHHFSVLHVITSHAWGGLELYTVALVQKLHDSGVKTAIYCLPNTKVEKEAKKLGIPVFHGIKQARISVKDILRLRGLIAKEKFDILHVHTRQDVWLASLTKLLYSKVKVIFSLYMSAPSKKDFIHRFIYKRISVITSSSGILNERIERNFPIDKNHVKLLRYGRDVFSCDKNIEECEKLRSIWNTDKKQIVITTMCRLDPQKGVREIAESLLLLKTDVKAKVKIWIMGEPTLSHLKEDGSSVYEEESEKLYLWLLDFIKKKEVLNHIELIPFQKNIIPYLESTDIFALLTYKETYSLSIIDAMNHGLPVIGTNTGGTPEQVQDGVRGILVNPKDPEGIAKAITAYVENPSLQKQHGKAAKIWVQSEHNWKHTIQQLINIYKK